MGYPPPETVKQWRVEWLKGKGGNPVAEDQYIAERAADWELEFCIKYFRDKGYHPEVYQDLRAARRPTTMTDNNHPITAPPELVREWAKTCSPYEVPADHIATQAANWGFKQHIELDAAELEAKLQKARDEELEACCEWLSNRSSLTEKLRAARRPKPTSLKERIATAIAHGDNSIALALLDQALPD
jgi:hypothetical protein